MNTGCITMKIRVISLSVCMMLTLPLSANELTSSDTINPHEHLNFLTTDQFLTVSAIEDAIAKENFKQAQLLSDQLLRKNPTLATAHYLKAKTSASEATNAILFSYSLAQQALTHFLQAEKLDPNNAKFKFALMSFYLNTPVFFGGDSEKAISMIAPITELSTHYGFLARLAYYSELKGKDEFEQLINEAKTSYQNDITLQLLLSLALWQNHYIDLAEQHLIFIASLKANTQQDHEAQQQSRYYLGKISLKNSNKHQEGISALNDFIENYADKHQNNYLHWSHYYLAQIYLEAEEKDNAKYHLNWLLKNPYDAKLTKLAIKKLKQLNQGQY